MVVEAELIAAAGDALTTLGFSDFTVRLNHRQALTGMLLAAGVPPDKHDATLVALDKLDKIGRDSVLSELTERGVAADSSNKLLEFFVELGSLEHAAEIVTGEDIKAKSGSMNAAILGRLVEFVGDNELGARGVEELRLITELCSAAGVGQHLKVDPSLARGLSYYTAAIMEINVKDLPGSLGGGGRYDNLVGMFLGQDVPACGFSLGLERIIVVMTELEMFPATLASSRADIMVTIATDSLAADSIAFAQELRRAGLSVDVYPEVEKLGKQFKYASSQGILVVVVIGEDERKRGEVTVKNMQSSEQRSIPRNNATRFLVESLRQ
jgi:histidyl-tRNA synthetase